VLTWVFPALPSWMKDRERNLLSAERAALVMRPPVFSDRTTLQDKHVITLQRKPAAGRLEKGGEPEDRVELVEVADFRQLAPEDLYSGVAVSPGAGRG
jgi:hypothetical protein